MDTLSLATLQTIAWSKLILLAGFLLCLYLIRYQAKRPWVFSLSASLIFSGFYYVLTKNFQTFWWGNNGDEIFIASYLTQVLQSNPLNDFYYHQLPNFYPPLYFWLTGLISRLVSANAVSAGKIGVATTLGLWFIGTYLWVQIYQRYLRQSENETYSPWLWFIVPLIFFFLIDFPDLILKPYEAFSALTLVLLVGLINQAFTDFRWHYKHYLFFIVSGGLNFLTFYFWWFLAIPALLILVWFSKEKLKNLIRLAIIGLGIFLISAIYLVPLIISFTTGVENWQAKFFVPADLHTFLPFGSITWQVPLLILGIFGLIFYRREKIIKANLVLLIVCYLYQFVNLIVFIAGRNPVLSAKPFLFLGSATLAVGSTYAIIELWKNHLAPISPDKQLVAGVITLILTLPLWPMSNFIDQPKILEQIEHDQNKPSAYFLAEKIKTNISDYQFKTWLTSGIPEINLYLPIHYYIAHNPHFSHQAAKYSQRLVNIEKLSTSSSSDFEILLNQAKIDALLLYKLPDSQYYPIFFWQDNYPNGGRETQINILKENVEKLNWEQAYQDSEWIIYLK
ncbi:MAG: arabinofuranosyltransferase [Patescibacteria group bacterium]|jgi:hypothetical protein|nr:arabinofuranosyltransferase [Patescibacteria group bacterium]